MKFIGLIPARGGSKGIEKKNIALLGGKPLIQHTCDAALDSTHLDSVLVSTDDQSIAAVSKAAGVDVQMRPQQLADDDTPMIDVMLYTLDVLAQEHDQEPDAIVLLQPTSPFRTSKHIDEAIELYKSYSVNTLVSVVSVPHQFTPGSLMKKEGDVIMPLHNADILRRQDKPKLYARNGPAILIVRSEFLREQKKFYDDTCLPYLMDERSSVDIDSPEDLQYAEFLCSL